MSTLLIDTGLGVSNNGTVTDIVRRATQAEAMGYAALWTSETQHDPFLPLALAAEHTARITLGTAIAVAFARSPMALAMQAWDLQKMSSGRFVLGLGTQVKAHVERRYGSTWSAPVDRMAEWVAAIRAIGARWQGSTWAGPVDQATGDHDRRVRLGFQPQTGPDAVRAGQ